MHDMSSEWGRIDDQGAVFVKTADGERQIGSWQAGDAEDALAYYVRRYEDLQTEVDLLSRRLESGAGDIDIGVRPVILAIGGKGRLLVRRLALLR